MCDFVGCPKPIRETDKQLPPEEPKFCEEHGAVVDEMLDGDPIKLFKWAMKNVNIIVPKAVLHPIPKGGRTQHEADEAWMCEICGATYLEHQVGTHDHPFKGSLRG